MLNKFQQKIVNNFDKEIYFIKVIIGEACPLRCAYCFVDKESPNVVNIETLKKYIDLLLLSPGENKLLHLLGGEPLLFFDIIKEGVEYARDLEKKLGKSLDVSFCTSGLYFDQKKLDFIKKQKIYLAWSIDGPENIHDLNRKSINKTGTFKDIITKKELVLNNIEHTHLGIAMTVDVNTVDNLFDSYKYLVDTELFYNYTINIAPVDGKLWDKNKQKKFVEELVKVYDYVILNINNGRFLYLNALNKEFRFEMLTKFRYKGARCLWFYTEAFSNGEVLFNPFVNKEKDYSSYVVGNINSENFFEEINKYIGCTFDPHSKKCNDCRNSYFYGIFDLPAVKLNNMLSYRDKISVIYANKIRKEAESNISFKEYINKAKDYMYV